MARKLYELRIVEHNVGGGERVNGTITSYADGSATYVDLLQDKPPVEIKAAGNLLAEARDTDATGVFISQVSELMDIYNASKPMADR